MKYSAMAAALGTLLVSSSAFAWDNPQGNTVAAKPQAQEKTYCIQFDTETGSRINRMVCKTKKEWQRAGVDVDNPDK